MSINVYPIPSNESKKYEEATQIIGATSVGFNYATALLITGAGYLKDVLLSHTANQDKIKVTVDGIVVYEARVTTASNAVGLINVTDMKSGIKAISALSSNSLIEKLVPAGFEDYPNVDSSSEFSCLLSNEIFFNESLLIEFASGTSGGSTIGLFVGGIEV